MTSRPSTATPILAVLAIVLLLLGAYVAGYFWLGKYSDIPPPPSAFGGPAAPRAIRIYGYHWQAYVFAPAAMLETWVKGGDVSTTSPGV